MAATVQTRAAGSPQLAICGMDLAEDFGGNLGKPKSEIPQFLYQKSIHFAIFRHISPMMCTISPSWRFKILEKSRVLGVYLL